MFDSHAKIQALLEQQQRDRDASDAESAEIASDGEASLIAANSPNEEEASIGMHPVVGENLMNDHEPENPAASKLIQPQPTAEPEALADKTEAHSQAEVEETMGADVAGAKVAETAEDEVEEPAGAEVEAEVDAEAEAEVDALAE
jgi:hypothetical protein